MPERKGVPDIVDENLRRGNAKAKGSSAETSSAASQKFREQRNRAPFRRSAPGPILCFVPGASGAAAHEFTRVNHFNCLVALLRKLFAPYWPIISLRLFGPPASPAPKHESVLQIIDMDDSRLIGSPPQRAATRPSPSRF